MAISPFTGLFLVAIYSQTGLRRIGRRLRLKMRLACGCLALDLGQAGFQEAALEGINSLG